MTYKKSSKARKSKYNNKTRKILVKLGPLGEVSKSLGVTYHCMYYWMIKNRIPPLHAKNIVKKFGKKSGVTLNQIRPDLWDKEG